MREEEGRRRVRDWYHGSLKAIACLKGLVTGCVCHGESRFAFVDGAQRQRSDIRQGIQQGNCVNTIQHHEMNIVVARSERGCGQKARDSFSLSRTKAKGL
jgi:hypothetical protein